MSMLKDPVSIGKLELRSSLVMPPMATAKADANGKVTPELVEYYRTMAKNPNLGLIITEHSYINSQGKAKAGQMSIASDDDIPGLTELVEAIHGEGVKVFAQLNHAGAATKAAVVNGKTLAPSAVKYPIENMTDVIPEAMTKTDIIMVIEAFVAAAKRAKQAGYDGVEIHSAHGYLLNQFYSPLTNKRTDDYSGSTLWGRIALHLAVIKAVRQAVGKDYPIALRLGASDYMEGGTVLADSVQAAPVLVEAGVDMLDISGGLCRYANPNTAEEGYFQELTYAIKQVINIPVMLTGGIITKAVAEQLLFDNKADLLGVGRVLVKNPKWPN